MAGKKGTNPTSGATSLTPADTPDADHGEFAGVSELASPTAGAAAPFGEIDFPLPLDAVNYTHPGPRDRPHLAGD